MTREARIVASSVLACVVVLLTRGYALAQTAPEPRVIDVDTSNYPDVTLTFEVPEAMDGLSWTATVVENGVAKPASIQTGASSGNEIVLVLDTSGSMAGAPLQAAKSAAIAFVHQLPPQTRMAVVGFGSSPYVVSPMTADAAVLEQSIAGVRASGETALYDALATAVAQFSLTDLPRSIVLVSDGGDTVSIASLDDVTTRLVDRKVRVFGLRLATAESNDGVLAGLAAATRGRTADAVDLASLSSTYHAIAATAFRQLRLTYRSEGHGVTPVDVRFDVGGVPRTATVRLDLPPLAEPTREAAGVDRPAAPAQPPAEPNDARLVVGAAALFFGLLALSYRALVRGPTSLLAGKRRRTHTSDLRELKSRFGAAMERTLERRGHREALSNRLEKAGVALRPGEYLVMVAAAVGTGSFIGLLLGGIALAVLFGVFVASGAWVLLGVRATKRRAALERQLPDFLQQTTSTLRAGYGIMQALDTVARESHEPLRGELRRVVHEVQLGRSLTESLEAMSTRVGGQDFGWVVQAIEINHEVGGDLVEVLDSVASTIRARAQLRRQIRTLSAQGRLSARILVAMPFILGAILSLLQPGWLTPLFTEPSGRIALMLGGVLLLVGGSWMRRITRLQY